MSETRTHLFSVRKICFGALFLALGMILPQVFHLFGAQNAGMVFLPMHIPVLLAGLLLGPFYGGLIGALAPVLSSIFFAMPPLPKLPFMVIELIVYGIVAGFFAKRKFNVYLSLVLAQIAGRLAAALSLAIAFYLFHLDVAAPISVWASLITGIPGIIIQLILIPSMVIMIRRAVRLDV